MATIGNFTTGALTNQTVCTIVGKDVSTMGAASATPYGPAKMLLAAAYHITAGAGVTAGTATFQELGGDGTWRNLSTPAAVSMAAPGEFNGTLTGPFHGLRISLSAITGGTVSFAELQAALVE